MKPRTAVVAALVLLAFSSIAVVGLGDSGPDLHERWTSDTSRDDRRNHHAVGVGGDVVVAPVTTVATTADVSPTACALVRLGADGSVRWRQGVAPANCTAHALTQPAIADLDDDGHREVATSTTEQVVRVHDAAFGDEQWRVPLSTYGYSKPAVGNLTGDPGDELVVSDIQGGVVAMSGETVRWRQTLSGFVWADPVIGDIDGDGTPEALVATSHNTTLLSAAGGVEWIVPADADSMTTMPTDDGHSLVFTATTGTVRALDGTTGETVWTRDISGVPAVHAVGDGRLYVGLSGGEVLALDTDSGATAWRFNFGGTERRPTPPPAVGDVDGDGNLEVVAVDNTGEVALLDGASGGQLDTYSRDVPIWTFPTVADVDDDGRDDIFIRYGDGRVVALGAI